MRYIRLKTDLVWEHMSDRMQYNPEIVEFHLIEGDLAEPDIILERVRFFQSRGTRVYLHHPMTFNGKYLDIISSDPAMREHYDWSCEVLSTICKQQNIRCIIHCHYTQSESSHYQDSEKRLEMRKRIERVLQICDRSFLWEDTVAGIFSAENPYLLSEIVRPLQLPLNIDISHSFIALQGSNQRLKLHLERYHEYAMYFHVVDSMGQEHDSLPIGKGKIDWQLVKPYVKDKDFIFEIDLSFSKHRDCTPMLESARYFESI